MCSQIATASPDETRRKPGTVGRPLAGVEVRIGEDGEILARGPTQALGYIGEGGALEPLADEAGWYHTGDLGRLDEDGDLWVVGRCTDRIVTGGVNVDALEVEEALRAHPAVIDACVVGVPDETWGERVAAWIEPVEGEFDLAELERWLGGRLSAAKRPRVWRVAPELPRNANGKVDRAGARAALTEG
jgi:O-succinylbenzoic acid--CoA ligase